LSSTVVSVAGDDMMDHEGNAEHFCVRIGGLVGGLLLGQGSALVAQTWLVAHNQLSAVASFGFSVAFLSLAQWTVDWGTLTLLARDVVTGCGLETLYAANRARLIIAIPILCALLLVALLYRSDPFASGMLVGGAVSTPFWALNATGFLDGHGKNAINGLIAGFPWIFASAALFTVMFIGHWGFNAGLLVGGGFTLGVAVYIVIQYSLLHKLGFVSRTPVTRDNVMAYLTQGSLFCLGEFPGQLYGRALLVIVSMTLGQELTGVYVYVRQITSGCAQVIMLLKRIEFPRLTQAAFAPLSMYKLVQKQRMNLSSAIMVLIIAIAMFSARDRLPLRFTEVAFYSLWFAAVLPVWALSTSFGQVIIAKRRMIAYSVTLIATFAVSVLFIVEFTHVLGLAFIAWCDGAAYALQIAIFAHFMYRGK
jgi:hypothetical protein